MNSAATLNINPFDMAVFTVLGLSALVAFFRGFIRELLSLCSWVGAAVITIYFFPHATELMKQHVKSDHVAAGAAALGTYVASLIGLTILFSVILKYTKTGAEVGLLDNFLGLIFGTVRGAFILSLGYFIMAAFLTNNPPQWYKTSIAVPYLQQGAALLAQVAPHYLNEFESVLKKNENNTESETPEQGYHTHNVKDLERIIDSLPSSGQVGGSGYRGQ